VGGAISSAGSSVGHFFSQNGVLVGEIVAITAASVLTFGAVDVALGATSLGAAIVAGAVAGAVAGGLSSAIIGGQFSWQAVAVGALTGAVSGGIGGAVGGPTASAGLRIAAGAVSGGATNWLAGAVQGHPSFQSFYQGAILGGVVSATLVGIQYLTSGSENSAIQSDASRSPGGDSSDNTSVSDNADDNVESDVGRSPAGVSPVKALSAALGAKQIFDMALNYFVGRYVVNSVQEGLDNIVDPQDMADAQEQGMSLAYPYYRNYSLGIPGSSLNPGGFEGP
jgi:hypothetical protein